MGVVINADQAVQEFLGVVDQIITTFLDGKLALTWALHRATELPEHLRTEHSTGPTQKMYYVGSDHGQTNVVLRELTREEFESRNRPGGPNVTFFGNMCLVALYQYWEGSYRNPLAEALGVDRTQLHVQIMGEVRHIRRAIIHNKAVALPKSENGRCLLGIQRGDQIQVGSAFLFAVREMLEIELGELLGEKGAERASGELE